MRVVVWVNESPFLNAVGTSSRLVPDAGVTWTAAAARLEGGVQQANVVHVFQAPSTILDPSKLIGSARYTRGTKTWVFL